MGQIKPMQKHTTVLLCWKPAQQGIILKQAESLHSKVLPSSKQGITLTQAAACVPLPFPHMLPYWCAHSGWRLKHPWPTNRVLLAGPSICVGLCSWWLVQSHQHTTDHIAFTASMCQAALRSQSKHFQSSGYRRTQPCMYNLKKREKTLCEETFTWKERVCSALVCVVWLPLSSNKPGALLLHFQGQAAEVTSILELVIWKSAGGEGARQGYYPSLEVPLSSLKFWAAAQI